ncbi:protein NO VEIN domain-containing protein [Nocardia sp. NPDC004151]|uniref:protein NO VEIN domain-containing protein n=1 Tax=Nocardia sp. NPDC004151 TaxID=3364304 RepID=UPI0036964A4B
MHGSHLASAVDIKVYAEELIDCGLALFDDKLHITPELAIAAQAGGDIAIREIASQLLSARPPIWLRLAVSETAVAREYIPTVDLSALLWLEPDLDRILIAAHREVSPDDSIAMTKEIGDAAELLVLAAMRHRSQRPIHVAKLSDSYGYDIEVPGSAVSCFEVKAAGPRTCRSFHISRNEFDTCQRLSRRWRLLQVAFNGSAFTAAEIGSAQVDSIRELPHDTLRDLVPPDTSTFAWEQSALITPPESAWVDSDLELDPIYRIPGFGVGAHG